MTYEQVLDHFKVKSRTGDSAKCICPAHVDKKASLSVSRGRQGTVIHCYAGCSTEDVVRAAGLTMRDLFSNSQWNGKRIDGIYSYKNIDTGKVEFTRLRLEGKSFMYGNYDGDEFKPGLNGRHRKDIPAIYGNLDQIRTADTVYYCEGEKDVNTVTAKGLCGFTCGGSSDWTPIIKPILSGKKVVILQDNDQAGEKLAAEVTASLKGTARTVTTIIPCTTAKGADITDYFTQGGTVEGLRGMETGFRLQTVAEIEEQEVRWLIPGYIPEGQITLLAGDGGEGKTAIWCNLVAGITTGCSTILDHDVPFNGKPGDVLFFSSEDSVPKVLKKRLRGAGADEKRIRFIDMADENFSLIKFNAPELEQIIAETRPVLVVFDPLQSFIPPDVQMGSRNAMRQCIAPLVVMGEKYGTTFLIVMHTNKKQNAYGRTRCADSADVWDQARAVLIAGSTGDPGEHYLSLEKSNYSSEQQTVLYRITDGQVVFGGTTDKHDRDYMQDAARFTRAAPARNDAKEIILSLLSDGAEHKVAEIDKALFDQGVTFATLKRSKADLKNEGRILYRSEGRGKDKVFYMKKV